MLCLITGATIGQDEAKPDKNHTEEVARVRLIKRDFVELTSRMLKVASLIEKDEPASAKAIRLAVHKAQAAFIAEDMGKVMEMLRKGMTFVAVDTGEEVAKELREVLRILERGVLDPDKRQEEIDRMKAILAQIGKLLKKQKELEVDSRMTASARQVDKQWAGLSRELANIVKEQKNLLKQTEALKGDPNIRKLSDMRDKVRELIKKQEGAIAAAGKAPVDKLPVVGEAQKSIAEKTDKVGEELQKASKDAESTKALSKAETGKALSQAAASTAQASGQMKKASQSLSKADSPAAAPSQQQALSDLQAAEKALSDAIAKASAGSKAAQLAQKQKQLEKKTGELMDKVEEAAKQADMKADSSNLSKAASEMSKASDRLGGQKTSQAAEHQKEAIKQLEDNKVKVAQLHRKAMEKTKKPVPQQEKEQGDLAERTDKTAEQMKKSDDSESPMSGQPSVASASKSMGQAKGQLGQGQGAQANASQKKAIEDLERAQKELQDEVARQEQLAQDEQLQKIDQMLESILRTQKNISAKTKTAHVKLAKEPDGREVTLELTELSNGEGRLGDEVGKIRQMLLEEGTTAVFPAVLQETRADLKKVQQRLRDKKPDDLTQLVQADVERSLQEMIDAIRKELSDRRKKKQQGGGGGGGGGGKKPPLVPPVAELKMLRVIQLAVYRRTVVLDKTITTGKITKDDAEKEHKELAGREKKLQGMTRELQKKLSSRR